MSLPRLSGRPFGRIRERLVKLLGAARDEPVRWPQVAKAALATGIAWELALLLPGKQPPVFAPLAAMLTIQVTAFESLRSAAQRTVGVIAGVLLAYALAQLLGLHWWSIALVILVAMALGQALALGTSGSAQVPVSALLVIGIGAATKSYAYARVLETLLGAAVGVAVSLIVVPPLHLRDSGRAVRRLAEGQAALLREIAADLKAGAWPSGAAGQRLGSARALTAELTRAQEAVERINDSVRLNPRARQARPAARMYREELDALQHVQVQIRGIARTLADEAARASEVQRAAEAGSLTDSGPLLAATVAGSAAVAAADSAHRRQYGPGRSAPAPRAIDPDLQTDPDADPQTDPDGGPDSDPGSDPGSEPGSAIAGDAPTRPVPSQPASHQPLRKATGPSPTLVPPPRELLEQLGGLIESVATALTDFGAAAVDDEGRVGSPGALHTLAQHVSETRRAVRETIRAARAADLTPATWLVVGSVLTDLRRMLGELEGSRDAPLNIPAYRSRRKAPRNPTVRRSFRPRRKDEDG